MSYFDINVFKIDFTRIIYVILSYLLDVVRQKSQ